MCPHFVVCRCWYVLASSPLMAVVTLFSCSHLLNLSLSLICALAVSFHHESMSESHCALFYAVLAHSFTVASLIIIRRICCITWMMLSVHVSWCPPVCLGLLHQAVIIFFGTSSSFIPNTCPMNVSVWHVMKLSVVGMFRNLCLTSLFVMCCSHTSVIVDAHVVEGSEFVSVSFCEWLKFTSPSWQFNVKGVLHMVCGMYIQYGKPQNGCFYWIQYCTVWILLALCVLDVGPQSWWNLTDSKVEFNDSPMPYSPPWYTNF